MSWKLTAAAKASHFVKLASLQSSPLPRHTYITCGICRPPNYAVCTPTEVMGYESLQPKVNLATSCKPFDLLRKVWGTNPDIPADAAASIRQLCAFHQTATTF
eukprot:1157889-Pelagomonas_calceolata.AAC.3